MTRKEYMEQLKKYLKRLPKEDYDNAIEYFSEYFDEAGPENEQQVMEELGQPKEAARELLLNLLQESVGDSKTSPRKKQQLCRQQVHITERAPMHIAGQIQET